ncbi:MAG: hypothetical protein AB1589_12885 [Cyanobacteriota bacterium]
MKPPTFLKNIPAPARMLFRPMLMISLVLHGVVLMLPLPPDSKKPEFSKKEEQVKITQLPTTRTSSQPSAQSSAKANPQPNPQLNESISTNEPTLPQFSWPLDTQPSPQLSESTPPKFSWQLNPQPKSQPTPSTRSEPKQQSANPILSEAKPKPDQNAKLETSQPDSEKSEASTSKSSPSQPSNPAPNTDTGASNGAEIKTRTSTDTDTSTGTEADNANVKDPLEDFLKNFPFPENVNVGSLGVLSAEADKSARNIKQPLGQVIKFYGKELPARQYNPLDSPVADDTDLKIYPVSKSSVTQYLHLISKGEDTIIFLSGEKLARKDLANLEAETAEEREFKDILRQNIATASSQELTSDIKSKIAGGKYNDLGILPGKTPEQLGSDFSKALSENGFKIANPMKLGSGMLLYGANKNRFTGYIQLILTEDGTGTAIIIYDDFPLS